MAFAESMGLPPPILIRMSIDGSFATASAASSNCSTSECCLMFVKVPAWRFEPRSFSTFWISGVFVASDEPMTMKAWNEEDGRQTISFNSTDEGP